MLLRCIYFQQDHLLHATEKPVCQKVVRGAEASPRSMDWGAWHPETESAEPAGEGDSTAFLCHQEGPVLHPCRTGLAKRWDPSRALVMTTEPLREQPRQGQHWPQARDHPGHRWREMPRTTCEAQTYGKGCSWPEPAPGCLIRVAPDCTTSPAAQGPPPSLLFPKHALLLPSSSNFHPH